MNFENYKRLNVQEKLRFWVDHPTARMALDENATMGREDCLDDLLRGAIEEIEFLRSVSGDVSRGRGFEDYRKRSQS
jgi:hypothetical protein